MDFRAISLFIAVVILFFLMTLWALVNISIKRFKTIGEKAAWWLIALIPFIGWVIYFLFGSRRGVKPPD